MRCRLRPQDTVEVRDLVKETGADPSTELGDLL